jgi:hypothetical protein
MISYQKAMLNYKEKFHNDPIKENNFEYQIL